MVLDALRMREHPQLIPSHGDDGYIRSGSARATVGILWNREQLGSSQCCTFALVTRVKLSVTAWLSILSLQGQAFLQSASLALLSVAQSTVMCGGLAAGLAVCVRGVARGTLTVGDVVSRGH